MLTSSDIHHSFSTLHLNFCNKKQETEGYFLKLWVTYTTKVLIPLKLVVKRVLGFYRLPVLENMIWIEREVFITI